MAWTRTQVDDSKDRVDDQMLDLLGRRRFNREQLAKLELRQLEDDVTGDDRQDLVEDITYYLSRKRELETQVREFRRDHPGVLEGFLQEDGVTTIQPPSGPSAALPGDPGSTVVVVTGVTSG